MPDFIQTNRAASLPADAAQHDAQHQHQHQQQHQQQQQQQPQSSVTEVPTGQTRRIAPQITEHERRRRIEARLYEWRRKLHAEQQHSPQQIEARVADARHRMLANERYDPERAPAKDSLDY